MRLDYPSAVFIYLQLVLNVVVGNVRSSANEEDNRYSMLRKRGLAKLEGSVLDKVSRREIAWRFLFSLGVPTRTRVVLIQYFSLSSLIMTL